MSGRRFPIGRLAAVVAVLAALAAATLYHPGDTDTPAAASVQPPLQPPTWEVRAEAGPFRGLELASRFAEAKEGANSRTLAQFNQNRAYPGAPPIIPHEINEDGIDGNQFCLGCHADGGYSREFKAFAPMTPHPDYVNCRQCHVPQIDKALFRPTRWVKLEQPYQRFQYLPTSPPPIPHSLGMRENCVACHTGPAAVKEILCDHPERINCRQCHVPNLIPNVADRFHRTVEPMEDPS